MRECLRLLLKAFVAGMLGAAIGAILLVATGCSKSLPTKPDPVLAQCDAKCYEPCVDEKGDTGIRWDTPYTDAKAFDVLAELVTLPLADKLRACEVNRKACALCLERLEQQGVIVR